MDPLLCAVSVLVVVAFVLAKLDAKHDREDFESRFPPISDAEFLALCPPGTNPAVALKVREMVAEHFAIEYARVHPSMSFVGDIGAD